MAGTDVASLSVPRILKGKQEPAQRGNSLKRVFQEIREMIIRGKLAPGTWIIEADLAERLGFSRTPVRGALQWLQREGYVSASGNGAKSRLIVAPLTKEDAKELYSIIGHIEGLGARLTAQLPPVRRNRLIRSLEEINEGLAELAAARRRDPDRIFDLDISFHRRIVEASAGPRLLELHRSTQPQAERYWRLYAGAILDELGTSVKEHNEIIRAISEGEPDAAERGIQLNWENGAERLAQVIETIGERGSW
jgi:DNA-binding GntR family transcriptional regulator